MLAAFCENIIHVGPPGAGHMLKLVNNFLAMTHAGARSARRSPPRPRPGSTSTGVLQLVSAGGVNSGIFQMMVGRRRCKGDLTGLKFAIDNAQKDLRYYTHLAETLPVASSIGEAVHAGCSSRCNSASATSSSPRCIEAQEKLNGCPDRQALKRPHRRRRP